MKYRKDPITEATLDFQYNGLDAAAIAKFEALKAEPPSGFTQSAQLLQVQIQSQLGPTVGSSTTAVPTGVAFFSADQKRRVQAHLGNLAYSELSPYRGWEDFSASALAALDHLRGRFPELELTRAGARYINHIDLPIPARSEEFFRFYPELPAELPQIMHGHSLRVDLALSDEDPESGALTLQQGSIAADDPRYVRVVLDIIVQLPIKDQGLSDVLTRLRSLKDDAFEACITDKLRERFQ